MNLNKKLKIINNKIGKKQITVCYITYMTYQIKIKIINWKISIKILVYKKIKIMCKIFYNFNQILKEKKIKITIKIFTMIYNIKFKIILLMNLKSFFNIQN